MGLQERMQIIGLMIKQNSMSNSPEKKSRSNLQQRLQDDPGIYKLDEFA
jgi:hypothetical protein